MKEVILDTIIDSLKLIPFLLVAFLIIELLEHKLNNKTKNIITKSKKSRTNNWFPIRGNTTMWFLCNGY